MKISLRNKILLLFLGLLVVSAVATIGSVLLATNNNVKVQSEEKLSVGMRVFEQLIIERGNQLFDSAQVLVSDYGFKDAVTSKDIATIQSALENNGARINANLMMLLGMDGKLIASVSNINDRDVTEVNDFPFPALLAEAEKEGGLSHIVLLNGRIFQLVMLPVEAPVAVAWSIVGTHIDNDFAKQLKELTTLDVTFWGESTVGVPARVSTLADAALINYNDMATSESMYLAIENSDQEYLTLPVEIAKTSQYSVDALLSTSLTAAYARFSFLKLQMLLIASATLMLSVFGAYVISRNVTRPIGQLVGAARRISSGDYQQVINPGQGGGEEIRVLSESLQLMQQGISEREEQLSFLAFHDGLTGVANRVLITQKLSELLVNENVDTISVFRISINQFKQVNDTFGYDTGDALLKELAKILVSFSNDNNLAARLNADEFALLLPGVSDNQILAKVVDVQEKIEQSLAVNTTNVRVNISMGVALYPQHGDEASQLLRRAEIGLNSAQEEKLPYALYEVGQDENHLRRITLINELKIALENDQLKLHFQPKVDLRVNRVTQVEALLRWIHADLGFISPEEFITLAEQSGLMPQLTTWVLQAVFSQAQQWQRAEIDVAIAVNLSAYDLVSGFPDKIKALLVESKLTPDCVILEITESAVMKNPDEAIRVLHCLRDLGFQLSIDDYGTGYSSLAQLKNMPVNELKIDKSFVLRLDEDDNDQAIVKSTIELGHNVGLSIVAEGVETLGSYQLLQQWGCDKLQGYYISRPLPAHEFEAWLDEYKCESHETNNA